MTVRAEPMIRFSDGAPGSWDNHRPEGAVFAEVPGQGASFR